MGYTSLPPTLAATWFREDLVDAFGKLRVSAPSTIFDSKQLNDNQPLFWDDQEVSGGGTSSTFSGDKASSTLAVTAATAGKRVRQTKMRFNYQPGKSLLILATGTLANQTVDLTDIITQIGYFDDKNGIFFSFEEGVLYLILRSNATGSPVDTKVAQADWNVDTLLGNGGGRNLSGITLDYTKTQLMSWNLEWLGVGTVRCGFVIDSRFYIVHNFLNSNIASNVYMSTPNLPVRYSIESTGTDNVATSMQHICCSVTSEGGVQSLGTIREIDTGVTAITAATAGTTYALIGIRLKTTHLDTTIDILKTEILLTSAGSYHWQLFLNPTIAAGTPSWVSSTNSALEYFIGDGAITLTGGTSIDGGYGASTGSGGSAAGASDSVIDNAIRLGSTIAGVVDIIVLAVTAGANNETFLGSLTTRELL